MKSRAQQAALVLCCAALCLPKAQAAVSARGWLLRMDEAARHVSYVGTFLYRHGNMLQTMRIYHRVGAQGVRERLSSLNGASREIIRGRHQIKCYLPDEDTLIVERTRSGRKGFPAVLPTRLRHLDQWYDFQLAQRGRVAGREAQMVLIRPRDAYRYGYRLWADVKTGLLLRSDLLSPDGRLVEQFMFTRIQPGAHVTRAELAPPLLGSAAHWHLEGPEQQAASGPAWHATHVPTGFRLKVHLLGVQGTRRLVVQHFVYSDGLAAVSVFVQKVKGRNHAGVVGLQRMGAVHVYSRLDHGYRITVMGEVPMATVDMIGSSLRLASTGLSH